MAVRFDSSDDRISYTGGAGDPPSTTFTIALWAYLSADLNAFTSIYRRYLTAGTARGQLGTDTDGVTVQWFGPGVGAGGHTMTVGQWSRVAVVVSGGTATVYAAAGAAGPTTSSSGSAGTVTGANLITLAGVSAGSGAEWWNGRLAYVRTWAAALTQVAIEAEWQSATPVRTADLWADWPLEVHTDLTDHSGNGRHLTAGATPTTTEAGPPLATTVTGTGAANLGALSGSASGTRSTSGAASAPLDALTATATGTRTVTAAAVANLGALTASASGVRATEGSAVADLGALIGAATGSRSTTGTGAAPLGQLVATATGATTLPSVAVANLGALTATATATRTVGGVALASLGALVAVAVVPNPLPTGRIRVSGREPLRAASGREPRRAISGREPGG